MLIYWVGKKTERRHFENVSFLIKYKKQALRARKPLQSDKPNSVIDRSQVLPFIYDICHQIPVSAYPLTSSEQLSSVNIHGISTRKVYPLWLLPTKVVSSYLTFSPLSRGLGTVIFCGTCWPSSRLLGAKSLPLGGAMLYVVRTFLMFDLRQTCGRIVCNGFLAVKYLARNICNYLSLQIWFKFIKRSWFLSFISFLLILLTFRVLPLSEYCNEILAKIGTIETARKNRIVLNNQIFNTVINHF